jgi:hypothetical protein
VKIRQEVVPLEAGGFEIETVAQLLEQPLREANETGHPDSYNWHSLCVIMVSGEDLPATDMTCVHLTK